MSRRTGQGPTPLVIRLTTGLPWSIRQALEKVVQEVRRLLPSARDQPPQTRAEYERERSELSHHINQPLIDCTSLTPRLLLPGIKSGSAQEVSGPVTASFDRLLSHAGRTLT